MPTLNERVVLLKAAWETTQTKAAAFMGQLSKGAYFMHRDNTAIKTIFSELQTAYGDLENQMAALTNNYPTVRPDGGDIYEIILPEAVKDGAIITAEDVAADAELALELFNGGSEMLRIQKPGTEFSGTPTSGAGPLTVTFSDESTNSPTSREWAFGDGTPPSTAKNPTHEYSGAGTYTVSLKATNAGGSDTESKSAYITVTGE